MKKTCIRMLTIVLVVSLMLSTVSVAANKPTDSTQASNYISYFRASITPTGNGKFDVSFRITGTGIMTKLGASRIVIYKDGAPLEHVWYTAAGRGGMMGYNCVLHADTESFTVAPGAKYHVVVYFFASTASGNDVKTWTTNDITV